ncbi:MAG: class I SAM-dependent methyltransferase [Verrucomicrobia bacterium]|nr:class I SAM-dependent methyltransferase [Verrucomicrobiota bacterium]MCH8511354.1 cyclopropane-fatty-acyl-phospholipid synthase family protein [Kiritimatiellia bacterium]
MSSTLMNLAEAGRLPDALIRIGIRRLLKERLALLDKEGETTESLLTRLQNEPVAVDTSAANEQHYEVPTRFFMKVLGPCLKYSSCIWPEGVDTLANAEKAMLDLTCKRAELSDRMDILELGCGWGSLTLWMAQHFPNARILAVSNSATQRAHIETQALDRGFCNLEVRTQDMNDFDPGRKFDRIVSLEMFEHMRNPGKLLDRAAGWLNPNGKIFIHIFTHAGKPYLFEDHGREEDWMSRHFFTGGMMPSPDYLPKATDKLEVDEEWIVNGEHYSKTLEAWLERQDAAKSEILPYFSKTYGPENAAVWFQRWRMFWMACSELFAFRGGEEWPVHHYRFKQKDPK